MLAAVLPLPLLLVDATLGATTKVLVVSLAWTAQALCLTQLEPWLLRGSGLNLSPIGLLCSLVICSALLGLSGAVLSAPSLAVAQVLLRRAEHPLAASLLATLAVPPTAAGGNVRGARGATAASTGAGTEDEIEMINVPGASRLGSLDESVPVTAANVLTRTHSP